MLPSETLMLLIVTIVLTLALLLAAAGRQGFKVDQVESVYIPASAYTPQPEKKILRYNPTTGKMEYAYPSEVLRYNWSTGKMEYASPDEQLKYNPTTGEWEY